MPAILSETQLSLGSSTLTDEDGNLTASGEFTATKVHNAIWNDIADALTITPPLCIEFEPGCCYVFDDKVYRKSNKYGEDGILGIHSDTAGYILGYDKNANQLILAVAGFVLAYVDKEYSSGVPLTCTKNGFLTKATQELISSNPHKIIGTYFKKEENETYNGIQVKGRHWVKVR